MGGWGVVFMIVRVCVQHELDLMGPSHVPQVTADGPKMTSSKAQSKIGNISLLQGVTVVL